MKKLAVMLVLLSLLVLAACSHESAVINGTKTYEITATIHSLDMQINAADISIEHGAAFSVKSNLKRLAVTEKDGCLTIIDKTKGKADYNHAMLTLYVPADTVFADIDIVTGAGQLTAEALSAKSFDLELGAGSARFAALNAADDIDIKGGAGEIIIMDGALNDLDLGLGVGSLNLTAALSGSNDLEFGIGEANVTLIGSRDAYDLDIEKGLGSITVDGWSVGEFKSNENASCRVNIKGGIGDARINFKAE